MQQARHAKRALQRVLKVVVGRINRLVILMPAGEAVTRPAEHARDKPRVPGRKARAVGGGHFRLDGRRIFCDNWQMHVPPNIGEAFPACTQFQRGHGLRMRAGGRARFTGKARDEMRFSRCLIACRLNR